MQSTFTRLNTFLLVLLVLMAAAIIGVLANRAGAGSLDPPGPVAGTMHTLGDTPPSWDQVLDSTNGAAGPVNPPTGCNSDRFKCVMNYQQCSGFCFTIFPAVLDEETGLVWQRAPSSSAGWDIASQIFCAGANTGQRGGWRLPTVSEFMSLVSGGAANGSLPPGNPFSGVSTTDPYWTSNEVLDTPANALTVSVHSAQGAGTPKVNSADVWCVRGASSNR
jgi:hypothetical protein